MLPDRNERLVLHVGSAVALVPNGDPRRVGLSIGHDGSLALASEDVAVVAQMSIKDWLTLCEICMAVASALAQRDPALAPAATLDMAEVAGHA